MKRVRAVRGSPVSSSSQPSLLQSNVTSSNLPARRKLLSQLLIEATNVPIMLNIVSDWGARNVGNAAAGASGAIGSMVAAYEIWRAMP